MAIDHAPVSTPLFKPENCWAGDCQTVATEKRLVHKTPTSAEYVQLCKPHARNWDRNVADGLRKLELAVGRVR